MSELIFGFAQPVYPDGLPLAWRGETSGELRSAMLAYLDACLGRGQASEGQLELVRLYLEYYVGAPCWSDGFNWDEEMRAALSALRGAIRDAHSLEAINAWVKQALETGIDPL
jgi:hypothetical protein